MTLEEQLLRIAAIELSVRPESLHLNRTFEDQGFDSLSGIQCLMAIEDEFRIDVPDTDAESIHTLKEMADYLRKRGTQ